MKIFKIKSLSPNISDEQLERQVNTTSFISFERDRRIQQIEQKDKRLYYYKTRNHFNFRRLGYA